jgi:ankyrin repeat protein
VHAVFKDEHEVVEFLLNRRGSAGAVTFDGKTILHVAAKYSDLNMIEILQNGRICGVDPDAVDRAGWTAMDYFRRRSDAAELIEPFEALLASLVPPKRVSPSGGDDDEIEEVFFDAVESFAVQ